MSDEIEITPSAPSKAVTCLAIVALMAAAFFYFIAESSLSGLHESDAAGNAMASGFAALAEMALWAALIAFVALACKGAKLTADLLWAAWTLPIGGAVACNLAVMLLDLGQSGALRLTTGLVPVLTALFAIWVRVGSELSAGIRRIVGLGLAIPALVLLVPPFVEQQRYDAAAPQREAEEARVTAEYQRSEAQAKAAYEAEFRAKGPDNRIDDFLQYLHGDFEDEAMGEIRQVRSRQEDAVRLLGGQTEFYALDRLHEFNVEPDQQLCAAYKSALHRRLAQFVPTNPEYRGIPGQLGGQIDNYRWLMANGCDLRPQISRLARMIRSLLPDHYFPQDAEQLEELVRAGPGEAR
jgi:hypothetical protein